MKTFYSFLTLFLISAVLYAQDITGKWYGVLEIPGNTLRIELLINKSGNDYSCRLKSPDQGNQEIPTSYFHFKNPELKVEIENLQASYTGNLKNEEIKGTFTQMGNSLPLNFSRNPKEEKKPITTEGKIDKIFSSWDKSNGPGGAVGIMKDGKIMYNKAFGLASMEYDVANSPETQFNIGSVSKQFTAMGIVRLHEEGKLSVDDDIRIYLPDVPDFGHTITIRHMLQHTSGLRSLHALFGIAGWRDDDFKTNADLRRVMKYQRDLNFKPGEEFLYCNTGYMFMADIIEKVTEEKFADWMKSNVFEPLGLKNTYVEDKYNRIVPNNATSYSYGSDGFEREVEYWGYVGSGNVHSTTSDLLKWMHNFNSPKAGWESSFKMLETQNNFNNGRPNNYAFGVIVDEFRGKKRIQHNGAVGGFRAAAATFPNEKMSIVVLSNFGSANPVGKANEVLGLFIKDEETSETYISKLPDAISLDTEALKAFEGQFWNRKESYSRKIYLKDGSLMYHRSPGNESKLAPIGKTKFKMLDVEVDLIVYFNFKENKVNEMVVTINEDAPIVSEYFEPSAPNSNELNAYSGTYYSPELETQYTFYIEDNKLKWRHIRHGEYPLEFIGKDILRIHPSAVLTLQRNGNGDIEGFHVTNGRVRDLWFEKRS